MESDDGDSWVTDSGVIMGHQALSLSFQASRGNIIFALHLPTLIYMRGGKGSEAAEASLDTVITQIILYNDVYLGGQARRKPSSIPLSGRRVRFLPPARPLRRLEVAGPEWLP